MVKLFLDRPFKEHDAQWLAAKGPYPTLQYGQLHGQQQSKRYCHIDIYQISHGYYWLQKNDNCLLNGTIL